MKQKTLLLCLLVSALPMTAALAQWHQTSGPSGGNTTALFAQGETLFAGNYNYSTLGNNQGDIGTLYRSTDHGQHWTPSGNGLSGVVAALTANGPTLFAGTSTGVFRSTDGGSTWSLLNGTDGMSVQKMLHANGVLYVGTSQNGIYRSPDNGNTFLPSSQGLPEIAAVSAMAYVGTTLFIGVGSLYPSPEGVFRSADGGATWQEMNNGIAGIAVIDFQVIGTDIFVTSGGALYKSTDLGANWTPVGLGTGDYPLHMQVTADGFYVALQYQTSGWTFRRSADNGATWSPAGSFTVAGNIRELAAIGSELFAGTGNYASVYRSVDSAATWQRANENMTGLDTRAIFPAGGKLFSGNLSNEGVHVSTNGGATWQPSGSGLPDPWKTVYAFAQNASYLFAAVEYWGTYRSSDNGATWSPANGGLTFSAKRMSALAVDGNNALRRNAGRRLEIDRPRHQLDRRQPAGRLRPARDARDCDSGRQRLRRDGERWPFSIVQRRDRLDAADQRPRHCGHDLLAHGRRD